MAKLHMGMKEQVMNLNKVKARALTQYTRVFNETKAKIAKNNHSAKLNMQAVIDKAAKVKNATKNELYEIYQSTVDVISIDTTMGKQRLFDIQDVAQKELSAMIKLFIGALDHTPDDLLESYNETLDAIIAKNLELGAKIERYATHVLKNTAKLYREYRTRLEANIT